MRQVTGIAFLSTLTLVMGGCGLFGGGGDQNTAVSPSPTANAPTTQSPTPESFATPLVEQQRKPAPTPGNEQPKVVAVTPPELIPPTDPNQRRTQVQKERQSGATDPFGVLPIPPTPPEVDANTPAPSTPATQSVERAVPQLPQLPVAQPPTLRVGTANQQQQRGVPQLPQLSIPQTPTLRVGTNRNGGVTAPSFINTTGQRSVAPGRTITSPTRVQPQQRPRFGLGQAPQPSRPLSPQIRVAQRPQRTQQVASRTVIAPRPSSTNRTVARTPQRPSSTNQTVARAPQRPSSTNRTVARAPQRPSSTNRTVASQRRTVNPATLAQARPQTTNQPATTPTPNTTPTTPPVITPPAPPVIPTLPPAPEPTLARAVEVSGVVIVGNEPQAILKAPNEATSRYVRVGQRLSNGQILVKRIEVYEGSEPMVILEQNGVEVSKGVGERPAAPAQPGSQPTTPQATV